MALILDASPGGITSNAYATVPEANLYHEANFYSASWFLFIPAQQAQLLVMATRLLDEQIQWDGSKTTRTQALRWPRRGVTERDGNGSVYDLYYGSYTIDSTVIPVWLKNATAELARVLGQEDRTAESSIQEFTSMSIGSLSLTKDPGGTKDVIPASVRAMVEPYGCVASSNGLRFIKLERS